MAPMTTEAKKYPVTFILPTDKMAHLSGLEVERDWSEFHWADMNWIGQTYLWLTKAGYDVALSDALPDSGIVVYHPRDLALRSELDNRAEELITVSARADSGAQYAADFEIVQNGSSADGSRVHFIPHWPQPGLVPRDPDRGTRIENVSYKGDLGNLHPDFVGDAWAEMLEREGVSWLDHSQGRPNRGATELREPWHDYSSVDVVLAVRPDTESEYPKKPASKLVNAWHAGAPALLGPEIAFRELRTSPLDYMEVRSAGEALAAIRRLKSNPDLYRRMIENGRKRAEEFSVDSITRRWAELLFDVIPREASQIGFRSFRSIPRSIRGRARRVAEDPAARIRSKLSDLLRVPAALS